MQSILQWACSRLDSRVTFVCFILAGCLGKSKCATAGDYFPSAIDIAGFRAFGGANTSNFQLDSFRNYSTTELSNVGVILTSLEFLNTTGVYCVDVRDQSVDVIFRVNLPKVAIRQYLTTKALHSFLIKAAARARQGNPLLTDFLGLYFEIYDTLDGFPVVQEVKYFSTWLRVESSAPLLVDVCLQNKIIRGLWNVTNFDAYAINITASGDLVTNFTVAAAEATAPVLGTELYIHSWIETPAETNLTAALLNGIIADPRAGLKGFLLAEGIPTQQVQVVNISTYQHKDWAEITLSSVTSFLGEPASFSSSDGGLSVGVYVGIGAGAAVLTGALALLLWWVCRLRNRAGVEWKKDLAGPISDGTHPPSADPLARRRMQGSKTPKDADLVSNNSSSAVANLSSRSELGGEWEDRSGANASHPPTLMPEDITFCVGPDGRETLLGVGSYGQVFKGSCRGVQEVAIKRLHPRFSSQFQRIVWQEVKMMRMASRDSHIIQFYGACMDDRPDGRGLLLVMELMEGGDLNRALSSDRSDDFSWYLKGRKVAMDVAKGLAFLHSVNIVHRDIKSGNVLLSKEGAKIGDIGMAKLLSSSSMRVHSSLTPAGTFDYCAPELLMGLSYTEKVDLYSFGVLLWELCTHTTPRRGKLFPVQVPEQCPEEISALIDDCLLSDPSRRPSAAAVVARLRAVEYLPPPL